MKFEEPKNKNYCATVVKLDRFVDLPNCDNVKAAIIFGNSVIVSKSAAVGETGIFFPVECAISKEFLGVNNQFRDPLFGNVDPAKKGFFEQHGRVKAVKFRGHKSEGFWVPLNFLSYTNIDLKIVPIGAEFDKIGDHAICEKYIPKSKQASTKSEKNKNGRKKNIKDKIVDGQFRLHIETNKLDKNLHKIEPETIISITEKWHGTSAVFANVLVKRNLNLFEKALKFFGVKIVETEYDLVWSSRNVVKGVGESVKTDSNHYYDADIWGVVANGVKDYIPKGITVYGEIVGYTPTGKAIQSIKDGPYHYGCEPGKHKFLVYRITSTNEDGHVTEFSWTQKREFCAKYGLDMVKEVFYGRANEFFEFKHSNDNYNIRDWREDFYNHLRKNYVDDKMCAYNDFKVPYEGVVVNIEHLDECESYKCKSFLFLNKESEELDLGLIDIETEQSEGEEE